MVPSEVSREELRLQHRHQPERDPLARPGVVQLHTLALLVGAQHRLADGDVTLRPAWLRPGWGARRRQPP